MSLNEQAPKTNFRLVRVYVFRTEEIGFARLVLCSPEHCCCVREANADFAGFPSLWVTCTPQASVSHFQLLGIYQSTCLFFYNLFHNKQEHRCMHITKRRLGFLSLGVQLWTGFSQPKSPLVLFLAIYYFKLTIGSLNVLKVFLTSGPNKGEKQGIR